MNIKDDQSLKSLFEGFYGSGGTIVISRAPGRINLIGEHTDYNDGFVLPIGLDRSVVVAGRARSEDPCGVYSFDFDEQVYFDVAEPLDRVHAGWPRYVAAVCRVFAEKGFRVEPFEAVIGGDIPIGSGLSSSAALEVSTATFLAALFDWKIDSRQLALNCQAAEHLVGVNCGIMDQFTAVHAHPDSALFLDCRTLEMKYVPLPHDRIKVVICDTGVRHNLADTAYNERRESCRKAVEALRRFLPGIAALRDVSLSDFERNEEKLDPILRKRARHVVSENQRVLDSIEALRRGNLREFGRLLNASHESLKNDYEVSCPELDTLVAGARKHTGTYGARLVGAGFGGCTINIVEPEGLNDFSSAVSEEYKRAYGRSPKIYPCSPAAGAKAVKV